MSKRPYNSSDDQNLKQISAKISVLALKTATLPPACTTNTIFVGEYEIVIIDPATPYAAEQNRFDSQMCEFWRQGKKLKAVVLTHSHHDHSDDAVRISLRYDVPIWGHKNIKKKNSIVLKRYLEDSDRILLDDGQTRLEVLYTPGHSTDHLCFFEPKSKTLIVGDMAAAMGSVLIAAPDGNLLKYLASLNKLINLKPKVVLAGHGFFDDLGVNLLEQTLEHRLLRIKQAKSCLARKKSRPISLQHLARQIYGDKLSDFELALSKISLISTLEYLKELNKVSHDSKKNLYWLTGK